MGWSNGFIKRTERERVVLNGWFIANDVVYPYVYIISYCLLVILENEYATSSSINLIAQIV